MLFYAEDKSTQPHKTEIRERGRRYTPFSGTFASVKQAASFLERNGKFWLQRGVKLVLVMNINCQRRIIGRVKGTELSMLD